MWTYLVIQLNLWKLEAVFEDPPINHYPNSTEIYTPLLSQPIETLPLGPSTFLDPPTTPCVNTSKGLFGGERSTHHHPHWTHLSKYSKYSSEVILAKKTTSCEIVIPCSKSLTENLLSSFVNSCETSTIVGTWDATHLKKSYRRFLSNFVISCRKSLTEDFLAFATFINTQQHSTTFITPPL